MFMLERFLNELEIKSNTCQLQLLFQNVINETVNSICDKREVVIFSFK